MQQATLISYLDVFWSAAIFSLLMVPLALSLKNVKPGSSTSAGH
jgi:hypothetical protein